MAATQGYLCEFVDSVCDDLYCKKCNLVARKLAIASCCGESFCHACITDVKSQGEPCPACGKRESTVIEQIKNQRRINSLQVYCTMKERGCDWSGTLEKLHAHLDPDFDNCQYVDIKCPLNCRVAVPKNMLEKHMAQECTKRAYSCHHCSFRDTYEEVVNTHLPKECQCFPVNCPNQCGVTFERGLEKLHLTKICPLEEIECEFSGVGCQDQFKREDQEEHFKLSSQKHLTLTACLAVENNKKLQLKLLEHKKKHKEEEKKLKSKIEEQEKELNDLKLKMDKHEEQLEVRLREQKQLLEQQFESKLNDLKETLLDVVMTKSKQYKDKASDLSSLLYLNRKFEMKHFSHKKANKTSDWKSPGMYTHVGGYQFCIGVDLNGQSDWYGPYIRVSLWCMPGKFDDQLNWDTEVKFTIELLNQQEGANASCTETLWWDKPEELHLVGHFVNLSTMGNNGYLEHSKMDSFLADDSLHFHVSNITVLSDCCHSAK